MSKRVTPAFAGRSVLRAFPFPKVGAEVSQMHIEDHFRRRGLSMSEMLLGLRYATQAGWIRAAALQSFTLLEAGMFEVVQTPSLPVTPESVWHSWAHG